MAISCVYCDGEHGSAAEVRQCWEDNQRPESADTRSHVEDEPPLEGNLADSGASGHDDLPPALDDDHARPVPRPTQPRVAELQIRRGIAAADPGPAHLGRNTIVGPGQVPPSPWTEAERITIDERALARPGELLPRVRRASAERRRIVFELIVAFDRAPESVVNAEPHTLQPSFAFELDELFHFVWSNSVDLRDPDHPTWIGLDSAISAGATAVADGTADVVLPSGESVWIDGGPFRHTDPIDGVAVIPFVSIEHGQLTVPGANLSTADLAPDQLAAVTHDGGAARIIAPAGSGKTRVLTERARHLLDVWNTPAGAVSLVAFNKRAQEEIAERTSDLPRLGIRTLNAIGLAIVNGTPPFAPQARRLNTISEIEVRRIIGDLVTFPRRRNADPVAPWIEALSVVRLGLVDPAVAEESYDGDVKGLAEMWPKYRAALDRARAVDFDDQIYRAIEVLLTQPEARATAQRACRVMLVDEFQDLTPAHVLLIRLLSSPGGAVFGVGDDDQTIYGYNGADPAWLIDFADLFPDADSHPLEVNYRCPADIVEVVDRLLRHNTRRVAKTIRAASTGAAPGWSVDTSDDPVAATVSRIEAALDAGADPSEVAVLARVNAVLAPIQVALVGHGLPIDGGVGLEFAERTAIRSVLAWIRLATSGVGGPTRFSTDDVREALRRPSRSFHPRINDWICEQAGIDELERLAERLNTEKDADKVREFAADITRLQKLTEQGATTSAIVSALVEDVGLAGAVTTLDVHRRGMNRAAQGDDLTAIMQLARLHDDPRTFGSWLRDRLATRRSPGGVTLATVHRVKGQEWPHVVVHLADAEQYPHRLAEDVEEERRLFHVAVTRASRHASITTGSAPSPFIAELTTEPSQSATVALHRPEVAPAKSKAKGSGAKTDPTVDLDADGEKLYAALANLRNELRDGKPAYVVFDNKTAAAIADRAPKTLAQLAKVPGIGPAKLEKYGEAILAVVNG